MPSTPQYRALFCFIYYKIYDDDKHEIRKSLHPVPQADDPCLGRVNVPEIPIPHTARALVKAICERERLRLSFTNAPDWIHGTTLFKSADTPLAYHENEEVDLLSDQRPGATLQEPVILKVWFQEILLFTVCPWTPTRTELDKRRNPLYGRSATSQQRQVFIHYKIYDGDEKEMVKSISLGAGTNDPFIGRVDTSQIPPPHTVSALIQYICAEENRKFGFDWDKGDAFGVIVFKTARTPQAYNGEDTVDLLTDHRPGRTPQEPVILKVATGSFTFPGMGKYTQ
ncbi:hypothetical protein C8R43DRAFT_357718 [Mycena crocata]|nr:hypothetical protein C8R43DRAFT_357718 [Mycena crocata]